MLAGNMKYPGVNIRLAWPVLVSLLQLHNPAVVQLDVMLTERLCSNNARPSGSSGTLLTSFTLHLRRTVSRPLPTLLYDTPLLLQISTGQPTSCLTVHPSSFRLCRTAYFLFYRTPFSLQKAIFMTMQPAEQTPSICLRHPSSGKPGLESASQPASFSSSFMVLYVHRNRMAY